MEICQSANIQQYKPKYHSNKQQYSCLLYTSDAADE